MKLKLIKLLLYLIAIPFATNFIYAYKIDLYVENSASMYGYTKEGGKFEQIIGNIVSDAVINGFTNDSSITYNYINTKIYKQKCTLSDFITKMPTKSKQIGNHAVTDVAKIFEMVLKNTDNNTVSILVSDCILSPGRNKNAKGYFVGMEYNIKTLFSKYRNYATMVWMYESSFNGTYYDCEDHKKKINTTRPFYIWIFGDYDIVKEFLNKIDFYNSENIAKNEHAFFCSDTTTSFLLRKITHCNITERHTRIEKAKLIDGSFKFNIWVNFDSILLGDKFLCNVENYELNNNFYKIEKISRKNNQLGTFRGTHVITISTTKRISPTSLNLKLKYPSSPTWVSTINIDANDCDLIFKEENMDKTYGIKSIVESVYSGYNNKSNLMEINIKINQ